LGKIFLANFLPGVRRHDIVAPSLRAEEPKQLNMLYVGVESNIDSVRDGAIALRPKSALFFQPLLGLRPELSRRLGVDAHRDLNCV
jgi:hypothetical protein